MTLTISEQEERVILVLATRANTRLIVGLKVYCLYSEIMAAQRLWKYG